MRSLPSAPPRPAGLGASNRGCSAAAAALRSRSAPHRARRRTLQLRPAAAAVLILVVLLTADRANSADASDCFPETRDIAGTSTELLCAITITATDDARGDLFSLPELTLGPLDDGKKWSVAVEMGHVSPALTGAQKDIALMLEHTSNSKDDDWKDEAKCYTRNSSQTTLTEFLASRNLTLDSGALWVDHRSYTDRQDVAFISANFEPEERVQLHLLGCNNFDEELGDNPKVEVEVFLQVMQVDDPETPEASCARGRLIDGNTSSLSDEPCLGRGQCDQQERRCVCNPGFFGWACEIEAQEFDIPRNEADDDDAAEDAKNETTIDLTLAPGEWKVLSRIIGEGSAEDEVFVRIHSEETEDSNIVYMVLREDIIPQQSALLGLVHGSFKDDTNPQLCTSYEKRASLAVYNRSPADEDSATFQLVISASDGCLPSLLTILIPAVGATTAFLLLVSVSVVLTRTGLVRRRNKNVRTRSLSPKEIDELLPPTQYRMPHPPLNDSEKCSICLSDFEEADGVRRLPCEHFYHVDCVDRWVSKHLTCPDCRAPFEPVSGKPTLKQRLSPWRNRVPFAETRAQRASTTESQSQLQPGASSAGQRNNSPEQLV